jgi:hypothetical protein
VSRFAFLSPSGNEVVRDGTKSGVTGWVAETGSKGVAFLATVKTSAKKPGYESGYF